MSKTKAAIAGVFLLSACGGSSSGDGPENPDVCARQVLIEPLAVTENGIHWNGIHWNGIHWNGIQWDGIEWGTIEWNGIAVGPNTSSSPSAWSGTSWRDVDFRGAADAIAWNEIDYTDLDFNAIDWDAISWPALPVRWEDVSWTSIDSLAFADEAAPLAVWMTGALCGEPVGAFVLANPAVRAWLNDTDDQDQLKSKLHAVDVLIEASAGAGVPVLVGAFATGPNGEVQWHVSRGLSGVGMSMVGAGPATVRQQEMVTAHLASKINAFGALPISLRVDGVDAYATSDEEAEEFPDRDSDSFGNLFVDDGIVVISLPGIVAASTDTDSNRRLRYGCAEDHQSGFCDGGKVYVTSDGIRGEVQCQRGEYGAATSCVFAGPNGEGDSHGPYTNAATAFLDVTMIDQPNPEPLDAGPGIDGGGPMTVDGGLPEI